MPEKKIIYDFGSNNGDDIPYYLRKADMVVAVEANPSLCNQIRQRFVSEIEKDRLFVENCVLTADDAKGEVSFYLHRRNHVLSQFPKPDDIDIENYEEVSLPSQSVTSLLKKYGNPYYIKIDIEYYDEAIMRVLFENDICPPYISAESHSIEVFATLISLGRYDAFKLVDGATVAEKYVNHPILCDGRREFYSFPHHSAGPFGEDITGAWMTANNFFRMLAFDGLGWKDIHATNQVLPDLSAVPRFRTLVRSAIMQELRIRIGPLVPKGLRNMVKRIVP